MNRAGLILQSIIALVVGILLYLTSLYSYLLFHSIAEMFSIVIAGSVFIIGWNSRKYIRNNYLLFICTPYLFIALLDMLHTLSYVGMNIFRDYDYYANQVWIATRYLESITMLLAFFALKKESRINVTKVFVSYAAVTVLIVLSIFVYKVFPICFVEGKGLTPFKIYSEYIICGLLMIAIYLLHKNRDKFSSKVYLYLSISLLTTIATELSFTFYISNYGISNLVGHFLKIVSFYYVYKSILQTGLETPQSLIFKELDDTKTELELANKTKEKLISVIAHDLRGPVGSLVGLFKDLKEYPEECDQKTLNHFVDISYNSLDSVYQMLENTLAWVQLQKDAIKPELTEVKISSAVDEAIAPLKLRAWQKKIKVETNVDSGITALLDNELLKTVIRNIVNNAIKFCSENCRIDISAVQSDEAVSLRIVDNGPGIEDKLLKKIFHINKSDIAHIENSGTGLGLGISKEFINILNGSMEINSEVGIGTEIVLKFKKIY